MVGGITLGKETIKYVLTKIYRIRILFYWKSLRCGKKLQQFRYFSYAYTYLHTEIKSFPYFGMCVYK